MSQARGIETQWAQAGAAPASRASQLGGASKQSHSQTICPASVTFMTIGVKMVWCPAWAKSGQQLAMPGLFLNVIRIRLEQIAFNECLIN